MERSGIAIRLEPIVMCFRDALLPVLIDQTRPTIPEMQILSELDYCRYTERSGIGLCMPRLFFWGG